MKIEHVKTSLPKLFSKNIFADLLNIFQKHEKRIIYHSEPFSPTARNILVILYI